LIELFLRDIFDTRCYFYLILGVTRQTLGILLDFETAFPVLCRNNIERNVVGNKLTSKYHDLHA
jgi:hypothetical protein